MDIGELRARIEQHLSLGGLEQSFIDGIHRFADWIEVKQAEEAKEKEAVEFLQAHGYTVTK
jgi:hypothetical protein